MRLETQNTRTLRLAHNTGSAVRFTPARGPQGLPGPGSAAWAADTAVTTGAVRQAPDGSWIKSTGNRTTRPSFDTTEATFWEAVLASSGTVEATALTDAYASRTNRLNHAPAFGVYFPEAEGALGAGAVETTAVQAALTAAAGATLHIERGMTFVVDTLNVPSDTRITGGGTLKFKTNTAAFALLAVTDETNVLIEDITFDGNVANQAVWSESRHTLQIIGSSSHVTVRGCTFLNPVGDGIYIVASSGNIPTDLDIDGNSFIGTNANRNGVTMTACTDSRIRGNYFYQMSRDDMPGAIDLEPNATGDTITNVAITSNVFVGGGTPTLQKAVAVNNNVGADCTGIVIASNTIRGKFKYAIAVFGNSADKTKTQTTITGNVIRGAFTSAGSAAIILSSYVQASVTGNEIDSTADYGIRSVGATFHIVGNKIKNAAVFGVEVQSGSVEAGAIQNNLIEDCGTNAVASYGGIHIKGSYLTITGNQIISSVSTKTQLGIYIESGTKNFVDGNAGVGIGVRMLNFTTAPQHIGRNGGNTAFNSINGTYPPAAEAWIAGDTIFNSNAAAGGAVGWYCVTGGTPGTWVEFGRIGVTTSTTAALAAIGNAINTTNKLTGKAVFNTTTGRPVYATGTTAGAVWNDADGVLAHTPV